MNVNTLKTFFKDGYRQVEHKKVVVTTAITEFLGQTIWIKFAVEHLLISGWDVRTEK